MARIDVTGIGEYIREQRTVAELSLRQLAANAGMSNPYLSQVERGLRKPSAEILSQLAKALRISAESLYVKAGMLDEREGELPVTASLMSDQTLTDRQRRVLIEIYAAFQTENASPPETERRAAQATPQHAPSTTATKYANRVEDDGKPAVVGKTVTKVQSHGTGSSTAAEQSHQAPGSSPRLVTSGKPKPMGMPVDAAS